MPDRGPGRGNPRHDLPELSDEHFQRAREALAEGRFDLAEEAFARRELDLMTLVEDLRVYQAELEIQNQELRASRAELDRSVERFMALFGTLPIAELIVDGKGLIRETNRAAEQLFELSSDRLRQHSFIRLIADADRGAIVDALSSPWQAQRADLIEVGLRTVQGTAFIGDIHIARLPGEVGAGHEFVCAVIDRSAAVRQRQVLRDNAAALREGRAALVERIKEQSCLYDIIQLQLQHDAPTADILAEIVDRLPTAMLNPELAGARILLPGEAFASPGFAPSETMHEVMFTLPDGAGEGRLQLTYREDDPQMPPPALLPEEERLLAALAGHIEGFLQRRAALQALEESREAYRVLAEYSPEWEYWLGPDGRYIYISPACEQITGYPRAAFEDDPGLLARLLHPDDRDRYFAHRDAVLSPAPATRHADAEREEYRLHTHDGDWIWIDHSSVPVIAADGRWLGRRGSNRDITARKRAEAEAARLGRLYRTLSQGNQAIVRSTSEAELLPQICRIVVQEGRLSACLISRRDPATGQMRPAAASYATPRLRPPTPGGPAPDGDRRAPELGYGLALPILIDGAIVGAKTVYSADPEFFTPEVLGLLGEMANDVASALMHFAGEAARRHAEQGLEARERHLAAILKAAPVGIGIVEDRVLREANDHWLQLAGYAPEEVLDRSTRIFYPDEDEYQRVGHELYGQVRRGVAGTLEARIQHKDGHGIEVLLTGAALDPERPDGPIVSCVLDITERKRQEAELLRSRRRLEQAEHLANLGAWELDIPGRRLIPSAQWQRIHGTTADAIDLDELIATHAHPDDRGAVAAAVERALAGEGRYAIQHRIVRGDDGGTRVVQAFGELERDTAGEPIRIIGAALDITERTRAEQALREGEERLRLTLQATSDGIWDWDIASGRVTVNDRFWEMLGYPPDSLATERDALVAMFHPVDREGVMAKLQGHLDTGAPYDVELRMRRRDGDWLWIQARGRVVGWDSEGRPARMVGTNIDIAERKNAELAQQRSEERLRLTLQATRDGIWDWDVPSGRVSTNDRFFEMLGYASAEYEPSHVTWTAQLHPDDRPGVMADLAERLRRGDPFGMDFRLQRKDGTWLWVHGRGQVVARDAGGEPLRVVGTHTDISERKDAELAIQESNRRLREAERVAGLGHWQLDLATGQPIWSAELCRIFGLDPEQPPPKFDTHPDLFYPDDMAEYQRLVSHTIETGEPFVFTLRICRSDGAQRWLHAQGRAEQDTSGQTIRLFGTARDVTEQHAAEERQRLAAQVFESTADAVIVTDREQRVQLVNRAFCAITGHTTKEIQGKTLQALQAGRRDEALFRPLWAVLSQTDRWQGERWSKRKDGQLFRARITMTTVPGPDGTPANHVIVFSDVTSLYQTQEQLDYLTRHDALTGLPNRSLCRLRLGHGLQRAARDGTGLAVLILDLDRFRVINESLGTAVGDALLKAISQRLLGTLREADTLARLAGDELGILLEDLDSQRQVVEIAEVVGRLLACCAEPQTIAGQALAVTACVGIAVYPSDGEDEETLLRHADIALKRAKARGPNSYQFYEAAMDEEAAERLQIESCLRQALIAGELHLHYQPQVRLADGALVGAEALLRWDSPELGRMSPARFIPVAEEIGLIDDLGLWVLRQGCAQVAAWDRVGLHLPRLAINLSLRQIEHADLLAQIEQILTRTGIDPGRLELEVTESLIMRQAEATIATLGALRALGLRLVIDDFGTGYSSLAHLRRLPMHQLKIDKSFVDDLPDDSNSQAVARAVIALGDSLGLEILAEGVEQAAQATWLREAGCTLAQGYHYARPLPPEDLAAQWLTPP